MTGLAKIINAILRSVVMCRNIWRWTDTASGNKMQFHGFVLWRFEGKQIAERWATVSSPVKETSLTKIYSGIAPATSCNRLSTADV